VETLHTSHNSHTHTYNTHHSEPPPLKECLCSSSISSHNSRDMIPSHNSRNVMCLPSILCHNSRDAILSHNSRNAPASSSLRYHSKSYRLCISKPHKPLPLHYRLALLQNRRAKANCRLCGRSLLSPSTMHLKSSFLYNYRLAGHTSPSSTTHSRTPLIL